MRNSSTLFLRAAFVGTIALNLVGCGPGFEAIKPSENNEDLVYRVNDGARVAGEPLTFFPHEMPILPPDKQHLKITPFLGEEPRRVVEPGFNKTDTALQALGVVDLADQTVSPYDRVGRLEMRFPSYPLGAYSTCTAQIIGNSGVVLTAAHCVYNIERREWASSVAFRLRYNQGTYAQRFDWECMAMVSGWPNGHYAYDYALIKLRGTPPGGLGMTIGVGAASVDAVGYPRKYYDTERLVHVSGNKDAANPSKMPGNPMGKGSSGGAWITPTAQGLTDVVSVNSFYYTNDETTMYGPQLSSTTLKAYEFASRSCKDRVVPQGQDIPELVVAKQRGQNVDRPENILVRSHLDLSAGTSIVQDAHAACSCGGQAYFAVNTTEAARFIGTQEILTADDARSATVNNRLIELGAKERMMLGCLKDTMSEGKICQIDRQVRLTSDRKMSEAYKQMPSLPKGVTMSQLISSGDINRCVAACEKNDNLVCLNLGKGAIAALAPLAKFSADVDSSPLGDGILVRKDTIIAEYGGDASTNPDVCERSDITRVGSNVENQGWGCVLTTKALGGASLKTRLNMRANLRGTPSSWIQSLGLLTAGPATYYLDRELAPAIDFEGNPAFNNRYAGDIYASTKIADDRLVLATSNGCIAGYFKN
jgi:hypothetical protein